VKCPVLKPAPHDGLDTLQKKLCIIGALHSTVCVILATDAVCIWMAILEL